MCSRVLEYVVSKGQDSGTARVLINVIQMLSVGGFAFIGLCYLRTVMRENKVRVISSLIRAEFIDDILQSSKRQTFRYFHYSRVRYIIHQPSVFEVYHWSLNLLQRE
jgi:hypothetical protein